MQKSNDLDPQIETNKQIKRCLYNCTENKIYHHQMLLLNKHLITTLLWIGLLLELPLNSWGFFNPSPPNNICRISSPPLPGRLVGQNPRIASKELYFFNFGQKKETEEKQQQDFEGTKKQNQQQADDDKDPVEKLFSFFFGAPEEEPLGLKRFGKNRFPEQYPATVDEWAEPVVGDSPDIARLRPLLKNTNFETRKLQLTYDANRDGWNAAAFHKKVDKQGAGLVVATTRNGLVCGGYNPKGWVGYGEARGSIAAFLFCQNADKKTWTKLRKVGGASMAQMDPPESGPMFGADSLIIPLAKDNSRLARSKLGSYYERFADGTNTLFGKGIASVQLSDLKVYHGVYEEGEYIPFTDAEPFALY